MARFRGIEREHLIVRRAEADACLHYLLHHSATLTACSAVELLLEYLVSSLHKKLDHSSKRQANSLLDDVRNEERRTGTRMNYWGLNSWIEFYRKRGIINKLHKQLNLHFEVFNVVTLKDVNEVWNCCKHDPYLATHDTAQAMVDLLNSFLDEAQIKLEENAHHPYSIGHMSAQWLGNWEKPLIQWIANKPDSPKTDVLYYLVPLLDLFVRLIDDDRVDYKHKSALMVATNYVFSSLDLVPEDIDKLEVNSLVDDGAVLALSLYWLLQQDDFDLALLANHWPGGASVRQEAFDLYNHRIENHEVLFPDSRRHIGSRLVWKVIERISTKGPEALWENYWREQSATEVERRQV